MHHPPDSSKVHKQLNLCAPGGRHVMVSEPLCSREKNLCDADKELLISRQRNTRKIAVRLQLLPG